MSCAYRWTSLAFRREFCGLAHDYCLLGATNAELAEYFEVAPRTIDNWIAGHPAFADAVRAGGVVADARVARGLYERAVGYSWTVERKVLPRARSGRSRTLSIIRPTRAPGIFWLRNRRRDA